jgi:acyl-CoA thioesterase-1
MRFGIDVDQSWAVLLQSRLEKQGYEHRVVNASITGETTAGGAERIGPALANFKPALIILELGGNDGLRGFPPESMRGNLEKIITTSKASGAAVVLLGIRIPSNYGPRYTQAFESVFRETAESLDIPWIEFFMEGIALNDDLMQADGIHPNAAAQPKLLDNAWPIIETALKQAD